MSVLIYPRSCEIEKSYTKGRWVASMPYHRFKDRIKAAIFILQGKGVVVATEEEAAYMLFDRQSET